MPVKIYLELMFDLKPNLRPKSRHAAQVRHGILCFLALDEALPQQNAHAKKHSGFTLIELLIVIILLGIITTIGITSHEDVQDDSKLSVTRYEMQELKKALLKFRSDNRAFPCSVYNGSQRPYELDEVNMLYSELPVAPATGLQKKAWCEGVTSAENNALKMLMKFPYDVTHAAYTGLTEKYHPLWNADTKRGWRGPYLSSAEGLKDAWGNYYRLLDPELDFPAYDRDHFWCSLDLTDSNNPVYDCGDTFSAGDKPGNSARVVSNGPDGLPDNTDDISLDLLK